MSANVRLPHGMISIAGIADPAVRDAIMKINENFARLLAAVSELKTAVEAQGD